MPTPQNELCQPIGNVILLCEEICPIVCIVQHKYPVAAFRTPEPAFNNRPDISLWVIAPRKLSQLRYLPIVLFKSGSASSRDPEDRHLGQRIFERANMLKYVLSFATLSQQAPSLRTI